MAFMVTPSILVPKRDNSDRLMLCVHIHGHRRVSYLLPHKQGETFAGGQSIRSDLNGINLAFTLAVLLSHSDLHLFGFAFDHKMIGQISIGSGNISQRILPFEL